MIKREELEQVIAHLETQRTILGDAAVDASIAALRQQLAALESPPSIDQQRKQVIVLFADVSGFTAMSETMDGEYNRDDECPLEAVGRDHHRARRFHRQTHRGCSDGAVLLMVLKRPETPLRNNPAESEVRRRARKCDVSFGPRTEGGKKAWDTFLSLAATTKKLGVSFYKYIHDRVSDANEIFQLPDLIAQQAELCRLNASWESV